MKKFNTFKLAVISAVVIASTVSAQETQTSTSTVTISNAFDLTETTPLSFGTIRATQVFNDGVDTDGGGGVLTPTITSGAGIRIMSNGTAAVSIAADGLAQGTAIDHASDIDGSVDSSIGVIVDGAPGEYSIANAAPFTNLRVTDPDDTGAELTNPSAPAASKFLLDIDLEDMTIVGGGNDGDTVTATNLLTDAAGSVAFKVGGELTINSTATALSDGAYSGTYIIEVSY